MAGNTVLLLGCGAVGSAAARTLNNNYRFDRVILADRDVEKANSLAGLIGEKTTPLHLDASDDVALGRALPGVSVVLNTAGPFTGEVIALMRTVIDAGVSYADVNDDVDTLQAVFESDYLKGQARDRGVSVVPGLGLSPGETNVVARFLAGRMGTVEELRFYLVNDVRYRSEAVWRHRLSLFGGPALVWDAGAWTQVPGMSESEVVEFPKPWGAVRCYTVNLEPVSLPGHISGLRHASVKRGFSHPSMGRLMQNLVDYGLAGQQPVPVDGARVRPDEFAAALLCAPAADHLFEFGELPARLPRMVVAQGTENGRPVTLTMTYSVLADDLPAATAASLAVAARMLVERELPGPGVHPPEALDPAYFLWDMVRRGVGFHLTKTPR